MTGHSYFYHRLIVSCRRLRRYHAILLDRHRCSASRKLGTYLGVCHPFLSARVVGKICRQELSARLVGTTCRHDLSARFVHRTFQVVLSHRLQNEHALARWGIVNASCARLTRTTKPQTPPLPPPSPDRTWNQNPHRHQEDPTRSWNIQAHTRKHPRQHRLC
jgi:hypothetical protein